MKKRIYRNFFWVALITILVQSVLFVSFFSKTIHEQKQAGMKEAADFLVSLLEHPQTAAESFEYAASQTDLRITLIAEDGEVLFDNRVSEVSTMENHMNRPEIQMAQAYGEGSATRVSSTLQLETYYFTVKMADGSYLRLSSDGMSFLSCFTQLFPLLLGVGFAVILIALLTARRLTGQIAGVINEIDLEAPLREVKFSELELLQKRLDHQNRKVQRQLRDLKEQESKFQAITQNMNEGLIMLDANQRIIYMNRSCKNLFEIAGDRFEGKTILEFYDSSQMKEVVEAAFKGETHTATQKLKERKIQYFANPIMENQVVSGSIILVMDITERDQAERMRREFSANVSHELKTPLTSISGFAELMENHMVQAEDIPVFAGKIHKEASRLLSLVNDIIKVSRLDDNEVYFAKEQVDLLKLAEEIKVRLEPMANQQKVTVEISGEPLTYFAVRHMMNDLIYNLMENGIKYNQKGGSVLVKIEERKGYTCIAVKDTGIGIPMKYQNRIFERFFRVDKSHSKQTGGTGLGLSIVKHVVEHYGGYIEIHSTPGTGTEIITYLGREAD